MLQNIRKNIQGTMAKIIVALIVVPFALFGIESLIGGGGVQYVAEVNGDGISGQDLQEEINRQKRRLLMSMGDNIDPAMLDDQYLAGPALEAMIQKTLLLQTADDYDLAVSEQQLGKLIGGMEVFQSDGSFDPQQYRRVLSDQGYTPGGFKKSLREDLTMTQLRTGLASSEFVTSTELDFLASASEEQRDLRYLVIPLDVFRDPASVSEDAIEDWYADNPDIYQTPETVELDYIELTPAQFVEPVEESELRETYELEKDSFGLPEQRAVSHILFEPNDDETDAALLARIAAVQAQLSAGERSFADLAREYSQDVGSASSGGELGFTSGDSFPAEIESAVALLELNQVSDPVVSDAGSHLFVVTEIRPGGVSDFESVRADLEQRIAGERAQRKLITMVEKLRDRVFNAENLADPAAELDLSVKRSEAIARNHAEGLFANARLNAAAFSNEVLSEGYNSEVIELDETRYVVLRVHTHTLPELRPLDAVRVEVATTLADMNAQGQIAAQAQALLVRAREGASIEALALEFDYQWQVELSARRANRAVPPATLRRAFQLPAPAAENSSFEFVINDGGDAELFELVRVIDGDVAELPPERLSSLRRTLANELMRGTDSRFQKQLRDSADVAKI